MGQEAEREKRLPVFRPYQINGALLDRAKPSALVLHCLPAHRGEEITDEVIEGPNSGVFPQAENRLHVQKAVIYELLVEGARGRSRAGGTARKGATRKGATRKGATRGAARKAARPARAGRTVARR